MRKLIAFVAAVGILLTLAFPVLAQEEKVVTDTGYVVFRIDDNRCFVKGSADKFGPPALKRPAFDGNDVTVVTMDTAPYIKDGRTFVPVRYLSNALGVAGENIYWNATTQEVTLAEPGLPKVQLTVGKIGVKSNGQPLPNVDVAPEVVPPGRTTLPARFVAEALGYKVKWLPDKSLVVAVKGNDLTDQQVDGLVNEAVNGVKKELDFKLTNIKGCPGYVPQYAEHRFSNFFAVIPGVSVKFESGSNNTPYHSVLTIRYPCRQYANAKTDQVAQELLLANIGDPDLVQQIWEYSLQKTTRNYILPWKIFPGTGYINEIWVRNDDGSISVAIFR